MKTAKEMFEELGYKRVENHPKHENIEEYVFVTQDEPYIQYYQEDATSYIGIRFDLCGKRVWVKGYKKDYKCHVECPLNANEIKAINKQVEELGWNDEQI